MVKNSAFCFIKPHAITDEVKELVRAELAKKKISIKEEGSISAEAIEKGQLIDQHYYAIASKATLKQPHELPVPPEKFQAQFGISWSDALAEGKCYNAKGACKKLNLDADQLDKVWGQAKKAKNMVKFGGGFYCAEIEGIFVFNGFFMSMRSQFVEKGASIYYFVLEWDAADLAWSDFRGGLLGTTNAADSPPDSLRGLIYKNWKSLGLAKELSGGDNGVHASASPFEGLAEQMNWLSWPVNKSEFGQQMLAAGISEATIKKWSVDPQVDVKDKKQSLFDSLEDLDADACIELAAEINGGATAGPVSSNAFAFFAVGALFGYAVAKMM